MPEYQGLISFGTWELIFTLVNTVLLYFILRKFLYKPVKNMLEKRRAAVETDFEAATLAREEAVAIKTEYEARMSEAKEEAVAIVSDASHRATVRSEEIIAEANAEAQRIQKKASEQIELEQQRMRNELKNEVAGLAVMMAGKVVEKDMSGSDHEQLISNILDDMGGIVH